MHACVDVWMCGEDVWMCGEECAGVDLWKEREFNLHSYFQSWGRLTP